MGGGVKKQIQDDCFYIWGTTIHFTVIQALDRKLYRNGMKFLCLLKWYKKDEEMLISFIFWTSSLSKGRMEM